MVLEILRVSGVSMAPTLSDGDYVLALSHKVCAQPPAVGSVIVVRHPDLGVLVKRVVAVEGGRIAIDGDNPTSLDRSGLGSIKASQVLGRALLRIPKKGLPQRIAKRAA